MVVQVRLAELLVLGTDRLQLGNLPRDPRGSIDKEACREHDQSSRNRDGLDQPVREREAAQLRSRVWDQNNSKGFLSHSMCSSPELRFLVDGLPFTIRFFNLSTKKIRILFLIGFAGTMPSMRKSSRGPRDCPAMERGSKTDHSRNAILTQ